MEVINNFFKKEPNLSFVAAKIQQNCTGTGKYDSKTTRQGIICARNLRVQKTEHSFKGDSD